MSESSDVSTGGAPGLGLVADGSPEPAPSRDYRVGIGSRGGRRAGRHETHAADDADARDADEFSDFDESSDADRDASDPDAGSRGSGRRGSGRRRRTWRQGGTSVKRWGWELLGWAVLALGAGVLASTAATELIGGETGALLSQLALWVAFGVPLRLAQGWLEVRGGGDGAWPSYPSIGGSLPPTWLFDELLTAVVIAPVLEEFFFRGLVLVALYTAVRRMAGRDVAMFAAAIVSSALFVVAHALLAPLEWDAVVSLSLVGLTASLLVLLTGRLWAAVLVHVVYNGIWVALATVGTLLSA